MKHIGRTILRVLAGAAGLGVVIWYSGGGCHPQVKPGEQARAAGVPVPPGVATLVVKGEPVIGGLHGADLNHYFCPHCMTWMFTRPVGFDFVNVRPTMFDDTSWFRPYMETYASTKLPFAETGAVKSFATFPTMEDIGGLMKGYADWAG